MLYVHNILWELTDGEVNVKENPILKLFGVKNENINLYEKIVCNFIIFSAKWIIWKHRNCVEHVENITKQSSTN